MLIVSILIFNAIIVAFITFLFFFPFQKYELWTISLTVYMQFKSFIHRWTCKRKLIESRANHVLIHVTCFLWVMWSWRWLSRIFDDNKGLTFIFADIWKNERWSVNMTDLKKCFFFLDSTLGRNFNPFGSDIILLSNLKQAKSHF